MSKKIISVVLALVFVLTTFAVSAFAVGSIGYEEEGSTYTQTWALSEPVDNGDGTWTVNVSLTANYCVGAISFVVTNTDPTNAVLTSVEKGDALTYEANIQFNATSGLVAIIPEPATDAEKGPDLTNGGVIATLTYTLADGAAAEIAIENAPKTADAPGGDLIAVRLSDDNLTTATMIYGQSVVDATGAAVTDASITPVTIGAATVAEAELVLTDTGSSAGVIIDTNKTFGGAYAGVVYGFTQAATATFRSTTYLTNNLTATNGGTLTFARSIGTAGYGTGTTITVMNADGSETGKVYVVVIFGDVNADGFVNANDTTAIKNAVSSAANAPANSVKRMAANVQAIKNGTMLHTLNANDTTAMKNHVSGSAKIDPTVLATYQYTYNNFYQ